MSSRPVRKHILVMLTLTACHPLTSETGRQHSSLTGCALDGGGCVEVGAPAQVGEGCTDGRWVALLEAPNAACPAPANTPKGVWNASKLFSHPATTVPPGLAGYCLYEWSSPTAAAPNVAVLDALNPSFVRKDRDCAVVAATAESLATEMTWTSLRASFLAQAGQVKPLPGAPADVRVAIIDAAPTDRVPGPAPADRSGHGEAVGQIVNALACDADGGVCPAKVVTYLALPLVRPGQVDRVNGGRFGHQSNIASAVHQAVADWREDLATGASVQQRLILNLSLGWEPMFGGAFGAVADLPIPVRAVYAALGHARCQGALPIVAAGNDSGGSPTPTGPLFPAAWELRPSPTATQCAAAEGPGYAPGGPFPRLSPAAPGDYQPLVFAVSGIRADGTALSNARQGARARLVAPGAHAVVASGSGGPTRALTGSSAAAAVLSGVLATAWGYRADLAASDLMAAVWNASAPIAGPAQFCEGGAPCPLPANDPRAGTRRVSACATLREVCAKGGGQCPGALPACAPVVSSRPVPTANELAALRASSEVLKAPASSFTLAAPAVCQATNFRSQTASYPTTVCSDRQYPGASARPWAGPQPGSNACPVCFYSPGERALYLSLDPAFLDLGLESATLHVGDNYVALGVEALMQSSEVVIEGVDVGDAVLDSATLVFKVRHDSIDFSTESELIIKQ